MTLLRRALLLAGAALLLPGPRPSFAEPPEPRPLKESPRAMAEGFVEERVTIPIFGKSLVFRPEPLERTRGVVLFISGDGGFGLGVVEMARHMAPRAIVVGLSFPAWRRVVEKTKQKCWYPAGELEETAQAVEKIYHLPRYLKPILIGFSSGASAVYASLAQAPAGAFAGAVSLGFCPRLEVARPLCGHGDWKPEYVAKKKVSRLPARADLPPRGDGALRWTILQGTIDQVCDPAAAGRFAAQVPAARIVLLPKVGHGFSVMRAWEAAYDQAIDALLERRGAWEPAPEEEALLALEHAPDEIRRRLEALHLPLEIEWPEGAREVLIFVSGDGGWAELDQQVAASLSARGVGVVGWNALRYFWEAKAPAGFRADLEKVVRALPDDLPVFAGGYSFGAEVIPATLASALTAPAPALTAPGSAPPSPPLAAAAPPVDAAPSAASAGPPADAAPPDATPLVRVSGLVLVAPGPYAAYEISPLDWLRSNESKTEHSVVKSLASLARLPVLCLEPSDRAASGCPAGMAPGITRVMLPGGHHFGGDFEGLADRILAFLRSPAAG